MKKIFVLLFLAVTTIVYSQNNLSGRITDQITGEPVVGATIYFPQLNKGTSTSLEGFFKIENLPESKQKLSISAVGYATLSLNVNLDGSEEINIHLKPSAIEMEEVIISTPFHQLQSENVMKISRSSIEELRRRGNTTLAEGFTEIPGVESVSTGAGIGKPVIRGLSSNRVLVYTQGVRLENQQFGDEHGLGLSNSGVESVEVIKGPASLLYGSDALGGVLYLNPERYLVNDSTSIDAATTYFSNTLGTETNLGYKTSGEKFKFLIRGNYAAHSDYKTGDDVRVTNTRFNEWDFKTGIGFQNEKIKSDLRYNYNRTTVGIPEEIGVQSTSKSVLEPYQEIGNHIISLDNKIFFEDSSLDVKLGYLFNNRKEFEEHHEHEEEHDHEGEEEAHDEHGEEPALQMQLNTFNYDVKYHLPQLGKFETILGLQGMFQFNENLAEEILIPNATTVDAGIFATTHFHLEKIDMQAGLRFDQRSISSENHFSPTDEEYIAAIDKKFNSVNAAFGVKYNFTPAFTSRLNFSSGFRAPNLAELTSNGSHHGTNRYEIGNPDLDTEQAFQIDLVLEYRNEHFEIFGNGFYNQINNYIYLEPTLEVIDDNQVFNYVQNNAELYGGEAGFHLHPHPLDWLHIESSIQTVIGIQENDEYLPLIPATSFLNTFRVELNKLSVVEDFYSFASVRSTLAQKNTSIFETNTSGYNLVDLGFGGSFNLMSTELQFQVSGNNLLDRTYISHLSRLKPDGIANMGRNMTVSLRARF